jgi:hypothetical protein
MKRRWKRDVEGEVHRRRIQRKRKSTYECKDEKEVE